MNHNQFLDVQFHIPYENGVENEFSYENKGTHLLLKSFNFHLIPDSYSYFTIFICVW